MKLKLLQGQVWKKDAEYFRVVHVERLEVKYKAVKNLTDGEGMHHHVTKKEFCRLLKGATLLTADDIKAERFNDAVDGKATS